MSDLQRHNKHWSITGHLCYTHTRKEAKRQARRKPTLTRSSEVCRELVCWMMRQQNKCGIPEIHILDLPTSKARQKLQFVIYRIPAPRQMIAINCRIASSVPQVWQQTLSAAFPSYNKTRNIHYSIRQLKNLTARETRSEEPSHQSTCQSLNQTQINDPNHTITNTDPTSTTRKTATAQQLVDLTPTSPGLASRPRV